MTEFFLRIQRQLEQKLPFVVYCKPSEKQLRGIFQRNDHLYFTNDFSESGFVMSQFDGMQNVLFPRSEVEIITVANIEKIISSAKIDSKKGDASTQEAFETLVAKGIREIQKGIFQKVVLSRAEEVETNINPVSIFEKMLAEYPLAMKYLWFHPKVGMWLGATPEQLLKAEGKKFYTMALAGTMPFREDSEIIWQQKEKDEQQFVTSFILDNLKDSLSEIKVSTPYSQRAGNLVHIKTDIEGVLKQNETLEKVISILHPTPAVCGLPKVLSEDFILRNEGYDREFYTGFLGELNLENSLGTLKTDLFVNLRCMKMTSNSAKIYVGCGITKDSDPKNEYLETVNKAMTMKSLLL